MKKLSQIMNLQKDRMKYKNQKVQIKTAIIIIKITKIRKKENDFDLFDVFIFRS